MRAKSYNKMEHRKFQKKLFRKFKHLYHRHKLPMTRTCMCWGLSCGEGWHDLLWDLSEKIKEVLEKTDEYTPTYVVYKEVSCTTVEDIDNYGAFKYVEVYRTKHKILAWLYSFYISNIIAYTPRSMINVEEYTVEQVKEKFSSLRFYTNAVNDKVDELIREAEEKSHYTCEACGKVENKQTSGKKVRGWLYNRCDECFKEVIEENKNIDDFDEE